MPFIFSKFRLTGFTQLAQDAPISLSLTRSRRVPCVFVSKVVIRPRQGPHVVFPMPCVPASVVHSNSDDSTRNYGSSGLLPQTQHRLPSASISYNTTCGTENIDGLCTMNTIHAVPYFRTRVP